MARQAHNRDLAPVLAAAERWINTCLINDQSILSNKPLWTPPLVDETYHTFVDHPDYGDDDFMTKLKGQMKAASAPAQQLMAEMLWALLLFPSNMKARTKAQQVRTLWAMSGEQLPDNLPFMRDEVLTGIGSGGPGFNNYRPDEMAFLMELTRALKSKAVPERRHILTDYDAFVAWIDTVHREGSRQFRHMLRYFAFPDRVERISSNNNRRRILDAFGVAPRAETRNWSDRQLDDALFKLRGELLKTHLGKPFDFYDSEVKERWATDRKIKTPEGEVTVVVPGDEEEEEEGEQPAATATKPPEARQSIQTQGKLAEIGAIMGFKIWVPGADRARVLEFVPANVRHAFLETLPLNTNEATLDTIKQIDVLWLRRGSIVRAFEVEHTTAVYSGLLRMADLLALQPNMDIRLHIVAPDERRDKVFREMARPVFMLLERGPLSDSCTFISYESVDAIRSLKHLAHTNDGVLADYEERAETSLA
jgi:hypothetical protein